MQQFLETVPVGARAFLIGGDAGVGKTSLWQAALGRAESAGLRALVARPTEAETSFAFAALGDLLGADPEVLEDLPRPQRRALEVALLVAERDEPPDQQAVALATLAVLRSLARTSPVVVAVDDVQWLDRPTAAVLAFAARRLTDEPIGLLIAQRTAGPAPVPLDLDRLPAGDRLDPPGTAAAEPRRRPAAAAAPARLGALPSSAPPRARAVGRKSVLRARARARGAGRNAASGARRAVAGDARRARRRPPERPSGRCATRPRGRGRRWPSRRWRS